MDFRRAIRNVVRIERKTPLRVAPVELIQLHLAVFASEPQLMPPHRPVHRIVKVAGNVVAALGRRIPCRFKA